MSKSAMRTRVSSYRGRCVFRSPKSEQGRMSNFQELLELARKDIRRMAAECQERYATRDNALRWVRYENAAAAVQVYYNALRSDRCAEDFADAFEGAFGRPPNPKKKLRDCLLLSYGEKRKAAAGTDANALSRAVRDRVRAADIPDYIEKNGGLEKLRRGKARRDEHSKLIAQIDAKRLARFDRLDVNCHLFAQIKKVCESPKPRFVIVGTWSRLGR